MDITKELDKIADQLVYCARKQSGSIVEIYLDHWMHLLRIEIMEPKHLNKEVMEVVLESYQLWKSQVSINSKAIKTFDVLGHVFETLSGRKDRQYMGQFFTPSDLSFMIAQLMQGKYNVLEKIQHGDKITISDPTVGSGRMFLKFHEEARAQNADKKYPTTNHWYYGNDLDFVCTKMCLVNMWLHGMNGEATNANGLCMEKDYRFGYWMQHIPIALQIEKYPLEQLIDGYLHTQPPYKAFVYLLNRELLTEELIQFKQDIFDQYLAAHIWQSDVKSRITTISFAGDNHFHYIKAISKEESHQVPKVPVEEEKQKDAPVEQPTPTAPQLSLF